MRTKIFQGFGRNVTGRGLGGHRGIQDAARGPARCRYGPFAGRETSCHRCGVTISSHQRIDDGTVARGWPDIDKLGVLFYASRRKRKKTLRAGLDFVCQNSVFVDDFPEKRKRFQSRDISSFKITSYELVKKYFSLRNRKDVLSLEAILALQRGHYE